MADNSLTDPKDMFSIAYLQMLTAHIKHSFVDCSGTSKDKKGVDCEVFKTECLEVYFQAKCTSISSKSMIEEDENYIYYNFDIKKYKAHYKKYLALIILPADAEFEQWLETNFLFEIKDPNKSGLLLKARAFYLPINGSYDLGKPPNSNRSNNLVKIPKTNILNQNSLLKMVELVENPEQTL